MEKEIQFIPDRNTFLNFLYLRLESVGIMIEPSFKDTRYKLLCLDELFEIIKLRFSLIKNRYFTDKENIYIRTGHYCQFLIIIYELSRILHLRREETHLFDINTVVEKLFFLNVLNTSCDIFYSTNLPDKFFPVHPFGTVIGPRTKFSKDSSLIVYNNCNLGRNSDDVHPVINGELIMLPNTSIIGDCTVSGKVILSNGCYVYNIGELRDVIVFGSYPNNIIKPINSDTWGKWYEFN